MNILIDIEHMADINFYKNAVDLLQEKGHNIFITAIPRGKIIDVLNKEYSLKINPIGKHYSNKFGKVFGVFQRTLSLMSFMIKNKIDVSTAYGFYGPMAAFFLRRKSVAFYDDFEYKKKFNLCKRFSTRFIIPDTIPVKGKNIMHCNSYKELAYLHPDYIKPNKKILKDYKLKEDKYVFLREVSSISWNYDDLKEKKYQNIFSYLKKKGYKIVVSLEDKNRISEFKDCIILKEPVKDIYSLMYFSSMMISTGDTMIRESALMGIPSLYLGGRDMCANKELIDLGLIDKIDNMDKALDKIKEYVDKDRKKKTKKILSKSINRWDDMTKLIIENIEKC